jgi:hypothetical protein
MRFLNVKFEKMYNRIKEDAIRHGFSEEELIITNLSNPVFKTKSDKIWNYISLAYWLGRLDGIRYCDEMLNSKITLS